MKRTVIYIEALMPIELGKSTLVVPLNHTSNLVANGHPCLTTAVQQVAPNGTTFTTLNTLYTKATDLMLKGVGASNDKVEKV